MAEPPEGERRGGHNMGARGWKAIFLLAKTVPSDGRGRVALPGSTPNSCPLAAPTGSWSCHLCLRHLKEKASAYITLT